MDTILKAQNIKKNYFIPHRVEILKEINLTAKREETIAIMGRSGEGKSTLLQILGTLETPCSGTLEIVGEKVSYLNCSRLRNQKLAFIFQSFHLLDDYTVLDNVLMPAKIARQATSPGSKSYQHAHSLLEEIGLEQRKHFNVKLLSGGEKQRVAIARALCNHPDIIFADEPSGNLDQETAKHIHELLLNFVRIHHKTLIVVTHSPELARLCSTNYTLHEGMLNTSFTSF